MQLLGTSLSKHGKFSPFFSDDFQKTSDIIPFSSDSFSFLSHNNPPLYGRFSTIAELFSPKTPFLLRKLSILTSFAHLWESRSCAQPSSRFDLRVKMKDAICKIPLKSYSLFAFYLSFPSAFLHKYLNAMRITRVELGAKTKDKWAF